MMKNEIILYQSDDLSEKIEIKLDIDKETFWLSLNQLADLFSRDKSVISRHLKNIFKEEELLRESVVAFFATTASDGKTYHVEYFNLDAILSVGYRVNSKRGTQFRIWANRILKDYMLKGYALNNRLNRIEDKVDKMDQRIDKIDIQIQSNQLPNQGIFFNGQVFDAYTFVADLIRKADKSLTLIDNYIDDTVFSLLDKRKEGVSCRCYTKNISKTLQLDLQKHNVQYEAIEIFEFKNSHDRFLIIDEDEIYHLGASLKDLGKQWFAFSKMNKESIESILKKTAVFLECTPKFS